MVLPELKTVVYEWLVIENYYLFLLLLDMTFYKQILIHTKRNKTNKQKETYSCVKMEEIRTCCIYFLSFMYFKTMHLMVMHRFQLTF